MSSNVSSVDRTAWYTEARFGMFVHWGLYSVLARGEWVMHVEQIPADSYVALADRFNPERFRPDEWVALAREAGMGYLVLTTRHHDGFSLFDSEVSAFSAPKTAAGRDLVGEVVAACRKQGMRVGFYYSLLDWRWPAYFAGPENDPAGFGKLVDYVHAQVRELCSNYGQIDVLWYDGYWPYEAKDWRSAELNAMARELQPGILINNRSALPEDFDTPEQHLAASPPGRLWEACMTLNDHWGYHAGDTSWKTARQVIRNLTYCAAGGGNYLVNVGPRADGTIPPQSVAILEEVGAWLRVNGESVYGTNRGPAIPFLHPWSLPVLGGGGFGPLTFKGSTIYLHLWHWPGRDVRLARLKNRARSARLLATGQDIVVRQESDHLVLTGLPAAPVDRYDTVIAVEVEGVPETW